MTYSDHNPSLKTRSLESSTEEKEQAIIKLIPTLFDALQLDMSSAYACEFSDRSHFVQKLDSAIQCINHYPVDSNGAINYLNYWPVVFNS